MTTPSAPRVRHALVTGGGSGIGAAAALALARDGCDVTVWDLAPDRAGTVAAAVRGLGRRAHAVGADVGDGAAVAAAVAAARAALGPVHVVVTSAGISGFAPLVDLDEATWDRMLTVHLRGTYLTVRAVVPDMLAAGWGRIVTVASVAGLRGGPMLAHYAAAKGGVVAFTKAVAIELGPQGVTANCVAPGMIDTPMLRASGIPDAVLQGTLRATPVRRLGTPEDVAAAIGWLASDAAGFTTGQVLSPNGGAAV
jgi:2-hydroxycyclohexanecarboxyl-CoA dehydrogenase